jgi:hypothetical protein
MSTEEITTYGTYHAVYKTNSHKNGKQRLAMSVSFSPSDGAPPATVYEHAVVENSLAGAVMSLQSALRDAPRVKVFIDESMNLEMAMKHTPLLLLARVAVAAAVDTMSQRDAAHTTTNNDIARMGSFIADLFSLIHSYSSVKNRPRARPAPYVPPAPAAPAPAAPAPPQAAPTADLDPLAQLLDWN